MNGCILINELVLPMNRGLTATDRLNAAKTPWSSGDGASWVTTVLAVLALVGGVALVGFLGYGYLQRRKKEAKAFDDEGLQKGLSGNDLKLLQSMVGLIILKNPDTIYTAEDSFNQAATQLMQQRRTIAMSSAMQAELDAQVQSMREKLGFAASLEQSSDTGGVSA